MRDYELKHFCEIDKYATKSYCTLYGVSEDKNLGDITTVNEDEIEPFTMICGGSPCVDFSILRKRNGAMWECAVCGHTYNPLTVHFSKRDSCPICGNEQINKTKSSLLIEWLRMIRAKKPKWGVYENVKNIVGKRFKETFDLFVEELREYGYNVYWKVLNAKDYGVPQNRERVYLIIIQKELDNGQFKFPEPLNIDVCLKDILEDKVDDKYYINKEMM